MSKIEDVTEYLISLLCPDYSGSDDDGYIYSFLKELEYSKKLSDDIECNSVRLLICLAIDLKTYFKAFGNSSEYLDLIQLYKFLILFTRPPYTVKTMTEAEKKEIYIPNFIKFAYALNENDYMTCKPGIAMPTKEKYIRIVEFKSFLKYIVYQNKLLNDGNVPADLPDTLDEGIIERYYEIFSSGVYFLNLNIAELGNKKRGWVFVADKDDIDNDPNCVNLQSLLDSLGFYIGQINKGSYYVSLNYPSGFDELSYQPTSATGDWGTIDESYNVSNGNEFFMSYYKNNNWGRTHSVSGLQVQKMERVHLYFDHTGKKQYEFEIKDLGALVDTINKGTSNQIISEALTRFDNA